MDKPSWSTGIRDLISRLRSDSDVATFRNEYRDRVAVAKAQSGQAGPQVELQLQTARELAERWVLEPSTRPLRNEIADWTAIADADGIPPVISAALLSRLPKDLVAEGAAEFQSFALRCTEPAFLDVLMSRRFLKDADLNALVAAKPDAAYRSAIPDVLIRRQSLRNGSVLWPLCVTNSPRPKRLLTPYDMLVGCYSSTPEPDATSNAAALLLQGSDAASRFLQDVAASPELACRLARSLLCGLNRSTPKTAPGAATAEANALQRLVAHAVHDMGSADPTVTLRSSGLIANLRCAVYGDQACTGVLPGGLNDAIEAATEKAALRALADHETGKGSHSQFVLCMTGAGFYHVVQKHLAWLASRSADVDTGLGRSAGVESFRATRELAQQVCESIYNSVDDNDMRQMLEISLFNAGVRGIGVEGEATEFDPLIHASEDDDAVKGDRVVIDHPGKALGDDLRVVLIKARVKRIT